MSIEGKSARGLKSFYEKKPLLAWLAGTLGPLAALVVLTLAFPDVFWDDFIYKYYWEPIVKDAHYNVVDTATYALVVIVLLFALHEFFRFTGTKISVGTVFAIVPFVIFGGAVRALEDSELVAPPVKYFLITPIIYFIIALGIALPLFIVSWRISKVPDKRKNTIYFSVPLGLLIVSYVLSTLFLREYVRFFISPIIVIGLGVVAVLTFRIYGTHSPDKTGFAMATYGLFLMTVSLLFVAYWGNIPEWTTAYGGRVETDWWVLYAVPLAVALMTGALWGASVLGKKWWKGVGVFGLPSNLLLFFAQMTDGVATYVGIEHFGYSEKHVLPDVLIGVAGGAWVMVPLKMGLVFLAIMVIDVWYKDDLAENPNLEALVRIIIILLGFGPGSRDLFRLAMGV